VEGPSEEECEVGEGGEMSTKRESLAILAKYAAILGRGKAPTFVEGLTDTDVDTVRDLIWIAAHVSPPTAEEAKEIVDLIMTKSGVIEGLVQ